VTSAAIEIEDKPVNPRTHQGLTLVELMVTVALVSVLMLSAIPSISVWLRNTQIRNTADSIEAGLQKARLEAVRRNQNVQFSLVSLSDSTVMNNSCALSGNAGSWVVSLSNPAGRCATAISDTVAPYIIDTHAVGDGGKNAAVSATNAGGASASTVVFDALGRAVSVNPIAKVVVSDAASTSGTVTLQVTVGSSGSIRVCNPDPAITAGDPRYCQ
jgi:type IV fimbrial biogenesis protein FimT